MPNACYVCGVRMVGANSHHVLPRADGGALGPQVTVCASCHTAVHIAARALAAGRSTARALAHLTPEQRERADALAQIAALAARQDATNPNPQLAVVLTDPLHMRALDQFKIERGFSSRDAAVNAILRELARGYGLFDEERPKTGKTLRITDFRGSGPS